MTDAGVIDTETEPLESPMKPVRSLSLSFILLNYFIEVRLKVVEMDIHLIPLSQYDCTLLPC